MISAAAAAAGGVVGSRATVPAACSDDDVVSKFLCEYSTRESLRDVAVDEMRRMIPKLLMEIDNRTGKTLKKVKGLWDNRPSWWNNDIPFFDPNNRRRNALEQNGSVAGIVKKATKHELLPVLQYLTAECRMKRGLTSCNTTRSQHSIVLTDTHSVSSNIICSTSTWQDSVSDCSSDWPSDIALTVNLTEIIERDMADVRQQLRQLLTTTCSHTQLVSTAVDALYCNGVYLPANEAGLIRWTEQFHFIQLVICLCLRLNYLPQNYINQLQQFTDECVKSELSYLPGLVSASGPSTHLVSASWEMYDQCDDMDCTLDNYTECDFKSCVVEEISNSMDHSMDLVSSDVGHFKPLTECCNVTSSVELCSVSDYTDSYTTCSTRFLDSAQLPSTDSSLTVMTQQAMVPASLVSSPVSRHSGLLLLPPSLTTSRVVSDRPNPLDSVVNAMKNNKQ